MAASPNSLKFRTVHANSWPPHDAVPGTAPFSLRGKVSKVYQLEVVPDEIVNQKEVVKGMVAAKQAPISYTAVELVVESYIRNPAEGEFSDIRASDEEDFFSNIEAFLEYLFGEPCPLPKRQVPHVWVGQDTFVFWVPTSVASDEAKVGQTVTVNTNCSTVTIESFGQSPAKAGAGLKLNKQFLPAKKVVKKKAQDDEDDWD